MSRALVCSLLTGALWLAAQQPIAAQQTRKVIIDQDAMGPGTTGQQAILMVLQAPGVETLGITVVTGDQWRDEEVAHTLRMLELTGHAEVPVLPGAIEPLLNTKEETARREKLYGRIAYQGAWNWGPPHEAQVVPPLREGESTLKPGSEDAAHFIVRMVHTYPQQVSILTGGPLTNIALAIALDPEVPKLAKELVFNGASLSPQGIPYAMEQQPNMEFNLWFDPEAAHIVLRAPWKHITCAPQDVTVKTRMTPELQARLAASHSLAARYVTKYVVAMPMWDELTFAAWIDPSIITERQTWYLDAEINHGASYGATVVWHPGGNPGMGEQPVDVAFDLDRKRFEDLFVALVSR